MSCESGLSTKQKYETQSELKAPFTLESISWNGHLTKHFNDRILEIERRLDSIETRHITEDNCGG